MKFLCHKCKKTQFHRLSVRTVVLDCCDKLYELWDYDEHNFIQPERLSEKTTKKCACAFHGASNCSEKNGSMHIFFS